MFPVDTAAIRIDARRQGSYVMLTKSQMLRLCLALSTLDFSCHIHSLSDNQHQSRSAGLSAESRGNTLRNGTCRASNNGHPGLRVITKGHMIMQEGLVPRLEQSPITRPYPSALRQHRSLWPQELAADIMSYGVLSLVRPEHEHIPLGKDEDCYESGYPLEALYSVPGPSDKSKMLCNW